MLTRLRLGFSQLCKRKVRYCLKDTLNLLCSCSIEAETTTLFPALPLTYFKPSHLMRRIRYIATFNHFNAQSFLMLLIFY